MVRGQTGSIALVQVFREKFAVEHRSGVAIKGQIWLEGDRLVATRERLFEALRCPTSFDIADVPSLHQRYHNARAELRNFASIEMGGLIVPTPAPMSPGVKSGPTGQDRLGVRSCPSLTRQRRAATATTTARRPTTARSRRSTSASPNDAGSSLAAGGTGRLGSGSADRLSKPDGLYSWPEGPASPSPTRGGSRTPESGTYSAGGAR
jgi:hypothetical protein